MKLPFLGRLSAAFLVLCITSLTISAQEKEVFKKKGLTLTFISNDASFSPALKKRLIETFFVVYPVLGKQYNQNTAKEVTFSIDTAYKGVAATSGTVVSFAPQWFVKHGEDIDVVTHEVMHIVQAYGNATGPWWVTEGIADYVRNVYGVNNPAAKWMLGEYKPGQKYDNGYRVTARFFMWLEKNGHSGIVKVLDKSMREHTYSESIWKDQTSKTLDELWDAYVQNPAI